METTISSKTKSVVIGPQLSFVIISERINPSGRKRLAHSLAQGDIGRENQASPRGMRICGLRPYESTIKITVPGVPKENINLRMHEDSFELSALREHIE